MAINLSSKTLAFFVSSQNSYTDGFTITEIETATGLSNKTVYNHMEPLKKAGLIKPCTRSAIDPRRKAFYLDRKALSQYSPTGETIDPNKGVSISEASILIDTVTNMDGKIDTLLAIVAKTSGAARSAGTNSEEIARLVERLCIELVKRDPDIERDKLISVIVNPKNIEEMRRVSNAT